MIETDRLILRPWQDADAAALYKYACDPDIGPVAGWPPHTSVENSLEIIRTVFAAPETYAVVLKSTGEPVGSCGIMFSNSLHTAEMKSGEAEIGYWIGKPYWGQGLIPEAVKALLARCFNDLHLAAVWCGYYEGNHKSKRVCEKCGFKYQHRNEAITSPLGDTRTEHFCLMTKEDYYNMTANMNSKFSFNTVGLFTTDNKKMVEFYRDIMGFTTDWNGDEPNVMMRHGDMWLIMFPRTAFEDMTAQKYSYPTGLNGTVELAFHVPTFNDVDAEYDRAVALGAKSVFAPRTMPWGQRTCYIADPEGNLIEIHSFTEK